MNLVGVAHAAKETTGLDGKSMGEPQRLDIGFLDADGVVPAQRGDESAAKIRVDIAGNDQFGLTQAKAFGRGRDFTASRHKSLDAVGRGILR